MRIKAGTIVERWSNCRKIRRRYAKTGELATPSMCRLGTVVSVGLDLFGKRCALVDWDEGGQTMCDNRDLRIVR